MTDAPDIPDLAALLALKASRPWAETTVPLDQGLRAEIEALEADLHEIAADAPRKRMGAESPLKAKAREIKALQDRMRESEVTFRFEALTQEKRTQVRKKLDGNDDPDLIDLALTAASCVQPAGVTIESLRQLRDTIGVVIYDATIKAASDKVCGGEWSVPFSSAVSHILGTET